jgi:hypothetical protein
MLEYWSNGNGIECFDDLNSRTECQETLVSNSHSVELTRA